MTADWDKHTLEYFTHKIEFVEMLLVCDAQSEIRDCLVDLRTRLHLIIVSNGMITNRLKKPDVDDSQLGALASLPHDVRLIIATYT